MLSTNGRKLLPFRTGENPDASHPELAGEVFLGLLQAEVFLSRHDDFNKGSAWYGTHVVPPNGYTVCVQIQEKALEMSG
jgi:hypothetical protein